MTGRGSRLDKENSSPDNIRVIKLRNIRWKEHAVRMEVIKMDSDFWLQNLRKEIGLNA